MDNKSFTIIELLVVIAIIGVLASIVLVSLSGTRDRAQIAKTLLYSNQVYHSLGADIAGNWKLDEGSGTTALDSSGYYNTGAISGATYTDDTPHKAAGQGQGKYALSFDGTNDYVNCGNNNNLNVGTGDFTIAGWIKYSGSFANRAIVSKKTNYASTDGGYSLFTDNVAGGYTIKATVSNGSTYQLLNPSNTNMLLSAGTWTYFAAIFNRTASTATFYKDVNNEVETLTLAGSFDSANNVLIGSFPGAWYFSGLIDEVQIYKRALTSLEIQKLYAQGLERHKNLAIIQK
jgi:prepilin-type N-terminal cleavage/methylation domain-containing protein